MAITKISLIVAPVTMDAPAGTVGGNWHFTLSLNAPGATVIAPQDSANPTVDFVNADGSAWPLGEYTATAQRMASDGSALGPIASHTFSVIAPTVSVDVAGNLTVNLA